MKRLDVHEQVRDFIRAALAEGRWRDGLPSERRLAAELGVARMTLVKALGVLEKEGVLARSANEKNGRRIVAARRPGAGAAPLRVGILIPASGEAESEPLFHSRTMLMRLLEGAGHVPQLVYHDVASGAMRPRRLASQVDAAKAGAWIVISGTKELLAWFEGRAEPVIRFGGPAAGFDRLSHAGYHIGAGLAEGAARLIASGHSRMVLLAPRRFRDGRFRETLPAYAALLEKAGIPGDGYHVPEWDDTPAGLEKLLASLFRFTPPTAIIAWNGVYASGVLAFLLRRRLRVPEDVSLFVLEYHQNVVWLDPSLDVAHLEFSRERSARNILKWAARIAAGNPEIRRYGYDPVFHEGRSFAPPKKDA